MQAHTSVSDATDTIMVMVTASDGQVTVVARVTPWSNRSASHLSIQKSLKNCKINSENYNVFNFHWCILREYHLQLTTLSYHIWYLAILSLAIN